MNPLRRRPSRGQPGHEVELLENGEAFYPAVFDAIARARREVMIETFILFEDKVGWALHGHLLDAARRGVRVDLLVDGFGSADLGPEFVGPLLDAGVRLRMFDPGRRWLGLRANWFRRLHRKLVVIDGDLAFVGGINYSADHLGDFGPEAKQDYAVSLRGPVVDEIHRFMRAQHGDRPPGGVRWWQRWRRGQPAEVSTPAAGAEVSFVVRDNDLHPTDIERHYRLAIRGARERVWVANAYFFPGWRLLRDLRQAARRGVDVRLILQGEPDMAIVKTAARLLYDHLARAGVRIYEYCERPLHGKVALADGEWSTVGSSNLDPLSLSLNLEANVVIRDAGFNQVLAQRLDHLMTNACQEITADDLEPAGRWQLVRSVVVFHVLRRFPSWARWLPAHSPRVRPATPDADWQPASVTGEPR